MHVCLCVCVSIKPALTFIHLHAQKSKIAKIDEFKKNDQVYIYSCIINNICSLNKHDLLMGSFSGAI